MGVSEWALLRQAVDVEDYRRGRIGPYQVGRSVRSTPHGELVVAIMDDDPRVVELELLAPAQVKQREQAVLKGIDQVLGLEHRHLALVLGAGLHEGVVYLARPFRLGRSLETVLEETDGDPELVPGLLYVLSDVVAFLAEAGPRPGSCATGGFELVDVDLGFDGEVRLRTGTQALRDAEAPAAADRRALVDLTEGLARWSGWEGPRLGAEEPVPEWGRRLRRGFRAACGERRALLGGHLRRFYADDMQVERARFGLSTLQ